MFLQIRALEKQIIIFTIAPLPLPVQLYRSLTSHSVQGVVNFHLDHEERTEEVDETSHQSGDKRSPHVHNIGAGTDSRLKAMG